MAVNARSTRKLAPKENCPLLVAIGRDENGSRVFHNDRRSGLAVSRWAKSVAFDNLMVLGMVTA